MVDAWAWVLCMQGSLLSGTWAQHIGLCRYNEAMSHVTRGGEELGTVFARFLKDRAEIERDYAKNMRKLVNKYSDKTTENKKTKETSQAKGFRWAHCLIKMHNKVVIEFLLQEMLCVMFLNVFLALLIIFTFPNTDHWFIKLHISLVLVSGLGCKQ